MAELIQQVKNSTTTAQNMNPGFLRRRDLGVKQTQAVNEHSHALQAFSNGESVPYTYTLRVVSHEGNKAQTPLTDSRKAPGYIRNELGGMFTS